MKMIIILIIIALFGAYAYESIAICTDTINCTAANNSIFGGIAAVIVIVVVLAVVVGKGDNSPPHKSRR